jgi:glycosyltransferase involved in cell wall biosynthesis
MVTQLKYSVVVPIYEEEENISILDKEIKLVMDKLSGDYEIIYINDGSKDNSLKELRKLSKVKIIDLNRNYGQATAIDAGFKDSSGEIVISLDGDLQNDPKDIPKMLEKLEKEKLDVVCGWRKKRKDSFAIKSLTVTGRLFRRILIKDPVHDTGCTLRVYRKKAVKSLDLQGEMHRYILALLRWKGFRIGEIIVNHRPRVNGETKYGSSKAVRGFIDLLYMWFIQKYSQRSLHFFGYLSVASFVLGILSFLFSVYQKIFMDLSLNRNGWFFLGFFFIIIGMFLFGFGMAINILLEIKLNSSPHEKRYYIREIIVK